MHPTRGSVVVHALLDMVVNVDRMIRLSNAGVLVMFICFTIIQIIHQIKRDNHITGLPLRLIV